MTEPEFTLAQILTFAPSRLAAGQRRDMKSAPKALRWIRARNPCRTREGVTDISIPACSWGLPDISVQPASDRKTVAEAAMISLAAARHIARFLQPRNPCRRRFIGGGGTVYCRPATRPGRTRAATTGAFAALTQG